MYQLISGVEREAHPTRQCSDVLPNSQPQQCFPAQNCIGSAKKGRVPAVLALLDRPVEQRCLTTQWIVLGDVVEPLRRLHECNRRIFSKVSKRPIEDLW